MSPVQLVSLRAALGAAGILGALLFVPWIPFVAALILCLRFRAYEVIAIGLFMDLLWLPTSAPPSVPWCTLLALLLLWALEPVRTQLLR